MSATVSIDPETNLVVGRIYRIHVPSRWGTLTALVKAIMDGGELCTVRDNGYVEPVRCEFKGTTFTPATPEECAEYEERSRW